MEIAEGQPFFLNLVSSLAQRLGDPDWEYPLTLREGVPLRVSSPTLQSPPRKNSEGKKTRSQTTHPSKKGTIIHQPKNSLMRLMPLLKMKRKWEWSWDPSPNKRQLRPANALQTNSVRDQWQGSKNPTRSGQFLTDHGVVLAPISKQTPRNEQQPPQSWTVFRHSTNSMPFSRVPPPQQVAGRRSWEMAGLLRLRIKLDLTQSGHHQGSRSFNPTGNTR